MSVISDQLRCPYGHVFGQEWEEKITCDDCNKYKDCEREYEKLYSNTDSKPTKKSKEKIKLNLEIDNIGEAISQSIVNELTQTMGNDLIKLLSKKIKDKLNYQVDSFIEDILNNFLDRKILITDKWGDKVADYENVEEMLKEKFDNFITTQVDSKGNKSTGCSTNDFTRLEYLIKKRMDSYRTNFDREIGKAANSVARTLEKQQIEQFNQEVLSKISKNLFETLSKKG